jgi:hypothetical protein
MNFTKSKKGFQINIWNYSRFRLGGGRGRDLLCTYQPDRKWLISKNNAWSLGQPCKRISSNRGLQWQPLVLAPSLISRRKFYVKT